MSYFNKARLVMTEGKNALFCLRFISVRVNNKKHVFYISSVTIKHLKSL